MDTATPTPQPAGPRLWNEHARGVLGGPTRDSDHIGELLALWDLHHPGADTTRIEAAWRCADTAHAGVTRRSGDPYITHPIEVAEITADLGMDEASVCAALLHDVVEDTDVTLDEIRELFDDHEFANDVASLVDGLTKLDGLHFDDETGRRAADLRRLLVAIADDPRVLVVKFADRLHNMRTLSALNATKRRRIANETLEVFAPLAHRLGMATLRAELEDLCFANLEPDAYATIAKEVAERQRGLDDELAELRSELSSRLDAAGVSATVEWRVKHLWGIYSKMVRQQRSFSEIFDVVGVRVIVDTEADCYVALGAIHSAWAPVPGLVKDYIATPRFNMYRSLHTTVWGPAGRSVEVQVRTAEMHAVAEWGVAAHWAYKEDGTIEMGDIAEVAWMRRLLEVGEPREAGYIDEVTGELVRGEIYCVTPKGRVVALPDGATPVDFAYQVHSEIGDRAVGARVDGNLVGLDHRLHDGARVEIVTSNDPTRGPNPAWSRWAATPKARQLIKRWHHRNERADTAERGRTRVADAVAGRGGTTIELDTAVTAAASSWGLATATDLYVAVGDGTVSAAAVAGALIGSHTDTDDRGEIAVEGVTGARWRFASCCDPHPPDEIVGWRTIGRGVTVHRLRCTNAAGLEARDRSRITGVEWVGVDTGSVAATVTVATFDHPGIVAAITAVLADASADIRSMNAVCASGRSDQRYDIRVGGSTALDEIERGIRDVDGVISVDIARDTTPPPATSPATPPRTKRRRRSR